MRFKNCGHRSWNATASPYLGDGAWGVKVRDVFWKKAHKLDQLVRAKNLNHLIRVTSFEHRQQFDAVDAKGIPIDSYMRFRDSAR